MIEIRVPTLNSNDTSYILVQWLAAEGAWVRRGDAVAVVETSKSAAELTAPGDGYLCRLVAERTECEAGQAIGRVAAAPGTGEAGPPPDPAAGVDDLIITGPARELMRQLGIGPDRVAALGRRIIRRDDVAMLGGRPVGAREVPLSRSQRAVAATVTRSRATIPAAFAAVRVRVDPALAVARQLTRRHRRLFGLPELVVKAVAGLAERFPLCFASPSGDGMVTLAGPVGVGVTIDAGHGLAVPVVRDAPALTWPELAGVLTGFRQDARRGGWKDGDLGGAAITVALNNDDDVSIAVPIVFPGQVCAVSLPGCCTEPAFGPDGGIVPATIVHLGLSYDHRIINGLQASEFLRAMKATLESPSDLTCLGEPSRGPEQ